MNSCSTTKMNLYQQEKLKTNGGFLHTNCWEEDKKTAFRQTWATMRPWATLRAKKIIELHRFHFVSSILKQYRVVFVAIRHRAYVWAAYYCTKSETILLINSCIFGKISLQWCIDLIINNDVPSEECIVRKYISVANMDIMCDMATSHNL